MSYAKNQGKALNQNENCYTDGTELIPTAVQANVCSDKARSIDIPSAVGYAIDDEGLINNSATEPDMYSSEYPFLRQQQQYIVL